jgi:HTH-type transcriptional regulator/antitoxin HipB
MDWNSRCAVTLKFLRIAHGLTQKQLAAQLGTRRTYISKIERGVSLPYLETLERLASGFGISVRGFIYLAERIG